MKLATKTRHGAKVHKVYDKAQTPYQRLLKAGILTEAKRQELAVTYHGLNPVELLKQINENLEQLWTMGEHHTHQKMDTQNLQGFGNMIYDATITYSVTFYFDATRMITLDKY